MLPSLGQAQPGGRVGSLSLGLEWDAYNDAMRLGSTRVRIYRLEFKLPGERQIIVRVSRVGEILQVQFPGQLVMDNEGIRSENQRAMIEIEGLTKCFGDLTAVDNISLTVRRGVLSSSAQTPPAKPPRSR